MGTKKKKRSRYIEHTPFRGPNPWDSRSARSGLIRPNSARHLIDLGSLVGPREKSKTPSDEGKLVMETRPRRYARSRPMKSYDAVKPDYDLQKDARKDANLSVPG